MRVSPGMSVGSFMTDADNGRTTPAGSIDDVASVLRAMLPARGFIARSCRSPGRRIIERAKWGAWPEVGRWTLIGGDWFLELDSQDHHGRKQLRVRSHARPKAGGAKATTDAGNLRPGIPNLGLHLPGHPVRDRARAAPSQTRIKTTLHNPTMQISITRPMEGSFDRGRDDCRGNTEFAGQFCQR